VKPTRVAPDPAAKRTGDNVRAEMARAGVTQRDLAQVLGRSQQAVSQRLNGYVAFDVSEITKVAAHLSVPASTLMPGEPAAA
jgi:transcriptional regulator with XRE-family HTH domain